MSVAISEIVFLSEIGFSDDIEVKALIEEIKSAIS
jgi:hypothetical protein